MKIVSVTIIMCILASNQYAKALNCPKIPVYNATIANICAKEQDNNVYWPNYQNVNQYYRCQGVDNPILESCLPNYVFDFVYQVCTLCENYIPAPPCQSLKGKTCTSYQPAVTSKTPTIPSYCGTLATYTSSFLPTCLGNDDRLLWPNYKNASEYYICQGQYNPLLMTCDSGTYFNYYAQRCTSCSLYVAAPVCSNLHFDKSNKCQRF